MASQADSNAEENITSHKMQEDPLADEVPFTRDSNTGMFILFTVCCCVFSMESIQLERPM